MESQLNAALSSVQGIGKMRLFSSIDAILLVLPSWQQVIEPETHTALSDNVWPSVCQLPTLEITAAETDKDEKQTTGCCLWQNAADSLGGVTLGIMLSTRSLTCAGVSQSSDAVSGQRDGSIVATVAETVDERFDAFDRRERSSLVDKQRTQHSHLDTQRWRNKHSVTRNTSTSRQRPIPIQDCN